MNGDTGGTIAETVPGGYDGTLLGDAPVQPGKIDGALRLTDGTGTVHHQRTRPARPLVGLRLGRGHRGSSSIGTAEQRYLDRRAASAVARACHGGPVSASSDPWACRGGSDGPGRACCGLLPARSGSKEVMPTLPISLARAPGLAWSSAQ